MQIEAGKRNTERVRGVGQTARYWKRVNKGVLVTRTTSGCKNKAVGVIASRENKNDGGSWVYERTSTGSGSVCHRRKEMAVCWILELRDEGDDGSDTRECNVRGENGV